MINAFNEIISSYTRFSEEEATRFLSFFIRKKFKKNEVLLEEGQVAHEAFLILSGAVRQSFITEEGADKVCNFAFEKEFITDLESFSRQSRSSTSLIALESVDVLSIGCTAVVKVLHELPPVAELFRQIVENLAAENIRRTKSMLSLSPEKQFEELTKEKPELLQRVPQRYIAQYLGLAPESLSRIRKRMMSVSKS